MIGPKDNIPIGHVYFVQRGKDGPIKIGTSTNIRQRLAALRRYQPEDLIVLKVIEVGREIERMYHEEFCHLRIRRNSEWFNPGEDLLEAIGEVEGAELEYR